MGGVGRSKSLTRTSIDAGDGTGKQSSENADDAGTAKPLMDDDHEALANEGSCFQPKLNDCLLPDIYYETRND